MKGWARSDFYHRLAYLPAFRMTGWDSDGQTPSGVAPSTCKLVAFVLATWSDPHGRSNATRKQLARWTALSTRQLDRAIKELKSAGIVERHARPHFYQLRMP